MIFHISPGLEKELAKVKKGNPKLLVKIEKQLRLFLISERHPSLRTHKLSGSLENSWSISIDMNVRMIYYINNDEAFFYRLGKHEEVYRMN